MYPSVYRIEAVVAGKIKSISRISARAVRIDHNSNGTTSQAADSFPQDGDKDFIVKLNRKITEACTPLLTTEEKRESISFGSDWIHFSHKQECAAMPFFGLDWRLRVFGSFGRRHDEKPRRNNISFTNLELVNQFGSRSKEWHNSIHRVRPRPLSALASVWYR